jgi:hypothetical protein
MGAGDSREWVRALEDASCPVLSVEQIIEQAVDGIGVAAEYWSRRVMTERAGEMLDNLTVAEQELAAAREALRKWRLSVMTSTHPNGRTDG